MFPRVPKRLVAAAVIVVVLAVAAGAYFWFGRTGPPAEQAEAAAPPPEVEVVEAKRQDVPLTIVYAGRVAAYREVEIRSQVGGILLAREFDEGSKVDAGQLLFRIDRRPYEVALDRANAQLAQAQATLRQTKENLDRIEELVRRQVATEKQHEDARAAYDQAQASVQLAQAAVAGAQLDLGYTTLSAPVAGITSLLSPPVGTLVQAQQTLLTTITQLDPAYVAFSFTDAELQEFRALNARRTTPVTQQDISFELRLADGSVYSQQGKVDVSARTVDPQTGTIQARAIFPNPEGRLLPGQFIRIAVRGISLPNAIVIPKKAVSQGPQGPFVYVVDDKGTAQICPIRLGRDVEDGWNIEEGLQGGERVVVGGLMRVRPGAPVRIAAAPAPETKAQL
jgi:membrane fusion protein (multidrug efflux system)